ncbi:MAG: anthranilate synthase component I family protein [Candidatus Nanopelagicales bacterium]|nr:anthranilate synthase component I family protein [Candidatus Nanopelagicales bacterium]
MALPPMARFGGIYATDLQRVTADISEVEVGGRWAVAVPFTGQPVFARFATWQEGAVPSDLLGWWPGIDTASWTSSMSRSGYMQAVDTTRARIERGEVYQVNICRIRSAALDPEADVMALDALLQDGNPAPYGGALRLPEHQVHIACASPELYLSRDETRIASGPIKGTATDPSGISAKDEAENIMIVDLVRNDLSRCAQTGSVRVTELLDIQKHPGLVQLVSTITADLSHGNDWGELLAATFPPGSVTGAPKSTAVQLIEELEEEPRSIYCGAFGWIDAVKNQAELAVAIRTFWFDGDQLKFGTGAGITWNSDAEMEWEETELKARRLSEVASWTRNSHG